jgi:hypothetical protein
VKICTTAHGRRETQHTVRIAFEKVRGRTNTPNKRKYTDGRLAAWKNEKMFLLVTKNK